ncbi:MAG: hypothetical protein GX141_02355 [Armatimonadetes bacterium]|nr:hypothetical protein [Armatimonadota bacterium]
MGKPQIDPRAKEALRLQFCEHNFIVPLRLDGRKLTLMAAHPNNYDTDLALAPLRSKYDVEVVEGTESEVQEIINANYYSRCETCGIKIELGRQMCQGCIDALQHAPPSPPIPQTPVYYVPPQIPTPAAAAPETEGVKAGPAMIGKTCPYCQTPIKPGERIQICGSCGIPHHLECWRQNNGCTTFGCEGADSMLDPSPQPVYMPPQQFQPPTPQGAYYPQVAIKDFFVESLLVTLFCCLPFGIIALVFSSQAKSRLSVGDYVGAQSAANSAKTFVQIGLGLALATAFISFISTILSQQ